MAVVDLQAVIAAPPQAVFAALGNATLRPRLDPSTLTIDEESVASGPLPEGSTFGGVSNATGEENAFDAVVVELQPGQVVSLAFRFGNGASLSETWRLSATPSGTLVRYHADLRLPGGILGRILDSVVVGRGFRAQREVVLRAVKAGIESQR